GQVMNLPTGAQGGAPVPTLLASNQREAPEPEAKPPASAVLPAGAPGTYTVRPGDSVAKIAKRLKMSEQSLLAANSMASTDKIFAGQTLRVPGSTEIPTAGLVAANTTPASPPELVPAAAIVAPATTPFEGPLQEDELEAALTPAVLDDGKPSAPD